MKRYYISKSFSLIIFTYRKTYQANINYLAGKVDQTKMIKI